MTKLSIVVAALALSAGILGHPGSEEEEVAFFEARSMVIEHTKRSLEKCSDSPAALALQERAIARRAAKAEQLRRERGLDTSIHPRDKASFNRYNSISHDLTSKGYSLDTPPETLFASNTTCALVPETIIGPYYVEGELIRTDITDGEPGVFSHVDLQFINIKTCKAIPNLLIDIWHSNSTGVYSGVATRGQGGLDSTFGRGVQISDSDGVVQFDTIFPGHYTGRTSHIHVMSTDHASILPNGTFDGGTVRHIGQMYFDESLIKAVEATEPYLRNRQPITHNSQDMFASDQATPQYDPFFKYVYLGGKVQDGLLLWLTIGLDPNANYNKNRTPAAHWPPNKSTEEEDD